MTSKEKRLLIFGIVLSGLTGLFIVILWGVSGKGPRQGGWDQRPLEGLQHFGGVPEFSLIERSGNPVRLSDLRGTIWIADFIYTHCTDTCPLQSMEMSRLQTELPLNSNVRLISITVDPERDRPDVLSRYANRYHADPDRWLFLTGTKEEILRLMQEGFRLSAGAASGENGQGSPVFLHTSRFVLVDGNAQIRGYYPTDDSKALGRLRADLKKLLRKKRI